MPLIAKPRIFQIYRRYIPVLYVQSEIM